MVGIIIGTAVALVVGILIPIAGNFSQAYGSELENFIKKKNPVDTYDVERLTREFEERYSRPFI